MTATQRSRRPIRLASIGALLALVLTMLTPLGAVAADDSPSAQGSAVTQTGESEGGPSDGTTPEPESEPAPEPESTPTVEPAPEPTVEPAPEPTAVPDSASESDSTSASSRADESELESSAIPDPQPETPDIPQPENQSDQPAPPSREKTIIENVHTDAVSAYLDAGELVLDTKVDMDVDGDGVVDLGTRLASSDVLFHLSDKAQTQVPNLPSYAFLGTPGDTIWLAPQTQNSEIIWPGFSTEDPRLDGQVQGGKLDVRMLGVEGPGELEIYLQNGPTVNRVFSSTSSLPAWSTGVPQHTHMNWAFTRPGTYTATFEMSGTVGGRPQSAQNDYTFVVGDLDAHTRTTATTLTASTAEAPSGEPILLTAEVTPADAVGAVQFRDTEGGQVLGHTPLVEGAADFVANALTPGAHSLVAEFVPTWSTDHDESSSSPAEVIVEGEAVPMPDVDDRTPPVDADFDASPAGEGIMITTDGKTLSTGPLSARLTSPAVAGRWLSVWIPGQNPAWQGWVQADLRGDLTVDLPEDIRPGEHRLAIELEDDTFLGWDEFTVTGGTGGGQTPVPPPPAPIRPMPAAPSQQCVPGVVLETGHIDAFFVSAANGRAVLQLMEDVTGHRVVREAESVLLRVKEAAYRTNIPGGTPGAPAGYVLPLTQNPGLIWPGWDTNRTAASGFSDVSIHVSGIDGPGRVHLSSQGSFGGVESLLAGGGYSLPGVIRVPEPAHTHAQWVFSQKGIYKLTVHAVATNPATGASLRTAAHTYVFQVGDVPVGDAFCGLRSADADAAKEVNAAVNAAAVDAVAAAQAAAVTETAAELGEGREREFVAADELAAGAVITQQALPVIVGIVGGGVLIIVGIVGAVVWYLRRLRIAPGAGIPTRASG